VTRGAGPVLHVLPCGYGEQVSGGSWVRQSGTASLLAAAYQRAPGGYIAFLDESFELDADRNTFYILSAVVTHKDEMSHLRGGLRKVVGGNYWHTTESLLTEEGRQRAVAVAAYLGAEDGTEVGIVAFKAPVDVGDGDAARAACFRKVGSALCRGDDPLDSSVHLMILEKRRTTRDRAYDASIVNALRAEGAVCRRCQLQQASPRDENLLWLPDLVSSAVRRRFTHRDESILEPISHIVRVVNCP
jgi:hypothetical protein